MCEKELQMQLWKPDIRQCVSFTEKLLAGLKDKDTVVRWSAAKGYVGKLENFLNTSIVHNTPYVSSGQNGYYFQGRIIVSVVCLIVLWINTQHTVCQQWAEWLLFPGPNYCVCGLSYCSLDQHTTHRMSAVGRMAVISRAELLCLWSVLLFSGSTHNTPYVSSGQNGCYFQGRIIVSVVCLIVLWINTQHTVCQQWAEWLLFPGPNYCVCGLSYCSLDHYC